MSVSARTSAAMMLVMASPTASRPEAGASSSATGDALPHGHRLSGIALEIAQAHGGIRDRNLPGTDHLVAAHETAHRAVADGDQE